MSLEREALLVTQWITQARKRILKEDLFQLHVETKTNRRDLVTNIDRELETFFRNKIKEAFPKDRILGEEGMGEQVNSLNGRVWFIDPIDGTANFVVQHNHFAIMLALYEDGEPLFGAIDDVMEDDLFYGIKGEGIFRNHEPFIPPYKDLTLENTYASFGSNLLVHDFGGYKEMAFQSMGIRNLGSAGLEILSILKGESGFYVSPHLKPWDIAAGKVMLDEAKLLSSRWDGSAYNLLEDNSSVIAYPSIYEQFRKTYQEQKKF